MTVYDSIIHRKYKEIDHMMGYQDPPQENMFLYNIYLENRVRKDHPLRRIRELIDFDFMYKEVEDTYGKNGNVSIPPPTVLKLMLLFFYYNVRSERELMETLPERLDWLWFLDYTIESPIPDHSVLSKARKRWGQDAFRHLFERIVVQCVNKGLIDGTKVFMDSSLIDADASKSSVVDTHSIKKYLHEGYQELEKRLEKDGQRGKVNARHASLTDPDASIVRHGGKKARLQYKTHRVVDVLNEVITAVEVTPGAVNEGQKMTPLIDAHTKNTLMQPDTVVADSQYGTIENLLSCHDRGMNPHMPAIRIRSKDTSSRKDIYPEEQFIYDKNTDTLTCPAGKTLAKRGLNVHRQTIEYAARRKDCKNCKLRTQCTRDNHRRSVQRHIRKKELDIMLSMTQSDKARRDIKTRKHLMERSFARSTRYGFDRARWRGLWKASIQEHLICAIQNIEILIRYLKKPLRGIAVKPFKKKIKQSARERYPRHLFNRLLPSLYQVVVCATF